MWFVDASVVVAILGREEDWREMADLLELYPRRLWSPVSHWECVPALVKRLRRSESSVRALLTDFIQDNAFELVAIGEREAAVALDAHAQYGKGSGHPAQLNMGDCFAYACARTNGARLLYKGDDFAKTDLA